VGGVDGRARLDREREMVQARSVELEPLRRLRPGGLTKAERAGAAGREAEVLDLPEGGNPGRNVVQSRLQMRERTI
jgi:hypothetical protein